VGKEEEKASPHPSHKERKLKKRLDFGSSI